MLCVFSSTIIRSRTPSSLEPYPIQIVPTGICEVPPPGPAIPVGTIWIGYGSKDDVRTLKIEEDNGRDINIAKATNIALRIFLDYYKEKNPIVEDTDAEEVK